MIATFFVFALLLVTMALATFCAACVIRQNVAFAFVVVPLWLAIAGGVLAPLWLASAGVLFDIATPFDAIFFDLFIGFF